mgnify:CR=1 FL=1
MKLHDRIKAFEKLGLICSELAVSTNNKIYFNAFNQNKCFTADNISSALNSISIMLENDKIEKWISNYDLDSLGKSKNVGVFLAGNIPLVGFHDFLCTLILGHTFVAKTSSNDSVLFKYLINILLKIEPRFKSKISISSNVFLSDIFICTGNNFTANFFNYKLEKKPKLIRRSKTSVAILNGLETDEEIRLLMKDIFLYFGLGCRSISKLYFPKNISPSILSRFFSEYMYLLSNDFYKDNINYYQTIFNLRNLDFLNFGSLLLLRTQDYFSPISVLYFDHYNSVNDIELDFSNIQCIISNYKKYNSIVFGKSQTPSLNDYADNVDTIDFLLKN